MVAALSGLAPHPVLAVEPRGVKDAPQAAVGVEEGRLRITEEEPGGRYGTLVVHTLACAHLHHLELGADPHLAPHVDRKSTRLNSSHLGISYAVFCLKK